MKQASDSVEVTAEIRSGRVARICIPPLGFEEIENAGKIKLPEALRVDIANVLNSYVLRSGWDRDTRPSKEKKANVRLLRKHVLGLLRALNDANRKLSGGTDFHPGIALDIQGLFWRAGIHPIQFFRSLASLESVLLEDDQAQPNKGGRPNDLFLPQFFCELEDIYIIAGGTPTGVTKSPLDGTRECAFADFVNAILCFAPAGIGPSSSPAVAVAWERQRRSHRAATVGSSQ